MVQGFAVLCTLIFCRFVMVLMEESSLVSASGSSQELKLHHRESNDPKKRHLMLWKQIDERATHILVAMIGAFVVGRELYQAHPIDPGYEIAFAIGVSFAISATLSTLWPRRQGLYLGLFLGLGLILFAGLRLIPGFVWVSWILYPIGMGMIMMLILIYAPPITQAARATLVAVILATLSALALWNLGDPWAIVSLSVIIFALTFTVITSILENKKKVTGA